jgi:two-component system sensor histidine kinase BaeS
VRSLRTRVLAMLVVVVLVALGTVVPLMRFATQDRFYEYVAQNRLELKTAVRELGDQGAPRIVFLGPGNKVIADSGGKVLDDAGAVALEKRPPQPDLPPGKQDVFVVRLAPPSGVGVPVEQTFLAALDRSLLIAVGVGGVAAVLLALLFARRVVGPIEALTAAARRMEAGDLSGRVAAEGPDEICELAHAFNQMAESLERTERLRRRLVGDVAHELRTPLSNLRGYLEALRDGVAEPTPAVVDSLYEEALLLSHLVDDLQELTLAEAGQLPLEMAPIDLAGVVAGAVAGAEPRAAAAGVALRSDLPADLPTVRADARRIGQVLRNLLANALTHTAAGEVVVSGRALGGEVEVSVRDTGCGIAAEHVPHVFERFYRADGARARATGGAGLGLAIVRELVEAHGGRVAIESREGTGTTVRFTLPAASGAARRGRELVVA